MDKAIRTHYNIFVCGNSSISVVNIDKILIIISNGRHLQRLQSSYYAFQVGTCESFFCVRIESRIESAVYTTQAVTPSNG